MPDGPPAPRAASIDVRDAVPAAASVVTGSIRAPDRDPVATTTPRELPRFVPFALAPAAAPSEPTPDSAEKAEKPERVARSSRKARRVYVPRRSASRYRAGTTANKMARTVSRNVRALQRTLGMMVYY